MRWKVLIVEDDVNFRYAMREVIPWKEHDFEIAGEAVNGRQALEILKEKEVHIVLTDMEMPIMNGVELTAEIKREYPYILIIALSAYDDFGFVKESMRLGAEDYILKQEFDGEKIIEILKKLCKKHMGKQSYELNHYHFQQEFLDYIEGKSFTLANEVNPYNSMKSRTNMMLCIVKSHVDIRIREEAKDRTIIFFMKTGKNLWLFLYQLPETRSKSDEALFQSQMLSHIRKFFPDKIQVGFCDLVGGFEELPKLYKMAERALMYFIYFPEEQIIHYLDIRKFEETRIANYLYQPPENLLDVYPEELEQVLKDYEKKLNRYMPEEDSVNKGFVNIYREFRKGIDICNIDLDVLAYYEKIRDIESVREKLIFTQKLVQREQSDYLKVYKGEHQEIRKALKYIERYYADSISLYDIADYVGLSENYFSNLFKQEVGENLTSYINKIRIGHAKKLLRTQSFKVYEIAEAVGYKNATYLSTIFKKVTGISISEYKAGKDAL